MFGLTVKGADSQDTTWSIFSCFEEAIVTVQESSQKQLVRIMGDQSIDEEAKEHHGETCSHMALVPIQGDPSPLSSQRAMVPSLYFPNHVLIRITVVTWREQFGFSRTSYFTEN